MFPFPRWRARLRAILGRGDRDRELDRELSDWVDELAARYEARGSSPQEARRRALIETEGVEQVKERVRDARIDWLSGGALLERLRFDLATAVRSLRSTPIATAAVLLTLAAAAGINLAMFGLVDRALLSPPARVADPGRVFSVVLHGSAGNENSVRVAASYPTFEGIRDHVPALAAAAAFQRLSTSVVIDGDQRQVSAMLVSSEYFDLLGVRPALGPGIATSRTTSPAQAVVLSHAFWHAAFGADTRVLQRRVSIGGVDYEVSGVMPEGFSGHSSAAVDLWVPFAAAMHDAPGWQHDPHRSLASIVVRLAPNTTRASAETQATAVAGDRATLSAIIGADVPSTERRIAWWLSAVSVLVLIIGLANAVTLLAVRASKQRLEVSIRIALGASHGRLRAQALVEALVLGIATALLALVLSSSLDEVIRRVLFPDVIAQRELAMRTIAAALCAGLLCGSVAAASTVWSTRRGRVGRVGAPGRSRTMTALLLVQTALSVLLLAGAAVFGRSLYNLAAQDFGMNMNGVVVVEFERGPGPGPRETEIFTAAVERIRAIPGVEAATVIDGLPFGGHNVPPISIPGRAEAPSMGGQLPFLNAATPEFLRILGVQIVEGRTFTSEDDRGGLVVIVNETMARHVWPGEPAIGKCIRIGFDPDFNPDIEGGPPMPSAAVPCRAVIGVARDVRQRSLLPVDDEARLMQYYVPFSQVPPPPFGPGGPTARGVLLRAGVGTEVLAQPIRRVILGQRSDLPFVRVVPYTELLERQMRPWRLGTTLLALFSALALGVAAAGLYAVFAHAVGERRREIAIRLALGAEPARVSRMVLREALMLAGIGVLVGWILVITAGRSLQSLLFETAPSDPSVLASVAGVMLIIAAAATWLPARSASKTDPNSLLKVE